MTISNVSPHRASLYYFFLFRTIRSLSYARSRIARKCPSIYYSPHVVLCLRFFSDASTYRADSAIRNDARIQNGGFSRLCPRRGRSLGKARCPAGFASAPTGDRERALVDLSSDAAFLIYSRSHAFTIDYPRLVIISRRKPSASISNALASTV